MCKKLILLFLLVPCWFFSQSVKYSIYEKKWATRHPFAAIKVKKISAQILQKNIKPGLDHFDNGGKSDAYRHAFYMAAFAQKIPVKKLRKLGIAHEKTNYKQFLKSINEYGELPDSLGSVMDLYNNELGFKSGVVNKKLNLEDLSDLIVSEIKKGNALIIKRNHEGAYVNCDNKILDLAPYSKRWYVPKCLVRSDYEYE